MKKTEQPETCGCCGPGAPVGQPGKSSDSPLFQLINLVTALEQQHKDKENQNADQKAS